MTFILNRVLRIIRIQTLSLEDIHNPTYQRVDNMLVKVLQPRRIETENWGAIFFSCVHSRRKKSISAQTPGQRGEDQWGRGGAIWWLNWMLMVTYNSSRHMRLGSGAIGAVASQIRRWCTGYQHKHKSHDKKLYVAPIQYHMKIFMRITTAPPLPPHAASRTDYGTLHFLPLTRPLCCMFQQQSHCVACSCQSNWNYCFDINP